MKLLSQITPIKTKNYVINSQVDSIEESIEMILKSDDKMEPKYKIYDFNSNFKRKVRKNSNPP